MASRDLLRIALTVIGLVVIVRAVISLPTQIEWAILAQRLDTAEEAQFAVLTQVTSIGASILVGAMLIVWSDLPARILFPATGSTVLGIAPSDLLAVLLAVVGVYLAVGAIPDLAGQLLYAPLLGDVYSGSMTRESWVVLATHATQMLLGVLLFVAARRLANAWIRITAGNET